MKKMLTKTKKFTTSIWFFPALLTVLLIILTILKISGSSIGVYHQYFYGDTRHDSNLISGSPRPIRGDEWNSTTQLRIGQEKNNFETINPNIGDGQNLSILDYGAYRDWSIIFKPQTLLFFVLPFDNAFAFMWWFMLYLLILSGYFFTLFLLPKKKLLASLLALGLAFSPFVQWWYLYGTLGSLYYPLFAGLIFMILLQTKRLSMQIVLGGLLAYTLTCFALVLYPPFQIPCALVVAFFSLGYLLEVLRKVPLKSLAKPLLVTVGAVLVAGVLVGAYLITRKDAVEAMIHTAYPGARVVESGGYELLQLFSGQFSHQLMNPLNADHYPIGGNQSEASNFILLLPALLIPGIFLLIRRYRKDKKLDWPLLVTSGLFILLLVRLYIPHTDLLFKILFLTSIPHSRVLIGIGLLSFIYTILIMRNLKNNKTPFPQYAVAAYIVAITAAYTLIGFYVSHAYPGFIGTRKALVFSLVIPATTYLLLKKRFVLSSLIFCIFTLYSAANVNPLYKDVSSITQSTLSQDIQRIASTDKERWVTESIVYENFPVMNGAHSLTGVYSYPQLDLWKDSGASENIYNRYAHIRLSIDREPDATINSKLVLDSPDTITISTEPCSGFLKSQDVRFILTEVAIPDSCVTLLNKVSYPYRTFYIYRINSYSPTK